MPWPRGYHGASFARYYKKELKCGADEGWDVDTYDVRCDGTLDISAADFSNTSVTELKIDELTYNPTIMASTTLRFNGPSMFEATQAL